MKELLILVPFCEEHMKRIRAAAGKEWHISFHPDGLPEEELRTALSTAEAVIGEPLRNLIC